jgi:soluble lytic murein transglycosylase-like protein
MNNILSKILCGFFIVFAISISLTAKAGFSDTTILLANNTVTNASPVFKTVIRPANIEFPACLSNQKDASLDYVEKFSNKKREFIIHSFQQGKVFFSKAAAILKQYHLPQELKVLLALESGFNPNAVSPVGAVGYWQIMDEVAKDYGLKIATSSNAVNGKFKQQDERKNFSKSTIAVAKYFTDRCKNLDNNILLMVAAYNWGIGNIRNAMRKSGKIKPDFWDIKKSLPAETRNYVMNFIALSVVYNNYDNFLKRQLTFAPQTTEMVIMPDVIKPVITAD